MHHIALLATPAGLHDHVRQLLHLKVKINSNMRLYECCIHIKCFANISPQSEVYLTLVLIPCVACPRSRGLAMDPVPGEHNRAGQTLLGCDVYTRPKSVKIL